MCNFIPGTISTDWKFGSGSVVGGAAFVSKIPAAFIAILGALYSAGTRKIHYFKTPF